MINAFYSAVSGMTSFQNKLNVSANNMANINTPGFKEQISAFSDLNYSEVYITKDTQKDIKSGNGVRLSDASSVLDQGSINQTGRTLDAAIEGDGYFKVQDSNGNEYYTRDGNFQVKTSSDGNYLVTANGDSVLDDNSQPITISGQATNIIFSANNSVAASATDSTDTTAAQIVGIGVYTFSNPYALVRDGDSRLSESQSSGTGMVLTGAKVKQGSLESSNVDMAGEMTNMLMAQRGFSLNSKVIQTADELENIANTLRG